MNFNPYRAMNIFIEEFDLLDFSKLTKTLLILKNKMDKQDQTSESGTSGKIDINEEEWDKIRSICYEYDYKMYFTNSIIEIIFYEMFSRNEGEDYKWIPRIELERLFVKKILPDLGSGLNPLHSGGTGCFFGLDQIINQLIDSDILISEEIKGENDLKRKKTKLCLNKESLVIHTYKVQRKGPGMVRTNVNWCGLLIDTYEQRVKERPAKRNLERAKKNAS